MARSSYSLHYRPSLSTGNAKGVVRGTLAQISATSLLHVNSYSSTLLPTTVGHTNNNYSGVSGQTRLFPVVGYTHYTVLSEAPFRHVPITTVPCGMQIYDWHKSETHLTLPDGLKHAINYSALHLPCLRPYPSSTRRRQHTHTHTHTHTRTHARTHART